MENRKSFILHFDSLDIIDEISDEQVGKLLKKMRSYHNGNSYISWDKIVDLLFMQFKNQFDRDLERYDSTCERNKENAKKRWDKDNKSGIPKDATACDRMRPCTENAYNDNKNDNDNDSKNDNDSNIIISSKEDRQVTEKKEYWDPIINSIIETIKFHNNWIIDGTIPSNRKHGKMLRDKIWKITGFNGDYVKFLSTLIERTDQYNISKTTSCESIYYNLALLVAKIKTTHIETAKKEEDQKPKVWSNRNTNSLTTT